MLAVFLIAASLAAQAWIFRDTPDRPADPCARMEDHCPEEELETLLARQAEALARQKALARGEAYPAPAPKAMASSGSVASMAATTSAPTLHSPPTPAAPEDSLQAEACRLLDSGD